MIRHYSLAIIGLSIAFTGWRFFSLGEAGEPAPQSANIGHVVFPNLADKEREDRVKRQLHFCAFDNGKNDSLYVGTKYGMFSKGKLELSVDGKVVAKLDVPHLVYGGVVLPLGDVFSGPPDPGLSQRVAITHVSGWLK